MSNDFPFQMQKKNQISKWILFAISSFAIVEEITSASEAEKDSPFVVKTSQCFALTYFCWPSKLTKISAYYFFSFSRSAHASHSAHSHKLLLFHLKSFFYTTKNTISGSKIKRNPCFFICTYVFFLSKNACSLRTSEYVDKPPHFALNRVCMLLGPLKILPIFFFQQKKPMSLCKSLLT